MGQREIIQALKNLGGKAYKEELLEEYFNICFPSNIYTQEYRQNLSYPYDTLVLKYIQKLKADRIVKREVVKQPDHEYHSKKFYRGVKRNKVLFTLLQ